MDRGWLGVPAWLQLPGQPCPAMPRGAPVGLPQAGGGASSWHHRKQDFFFFFFFRAPEVGLSFISKAKLPRAPNRRAPQRRLHLAPPPAPSGLGTHKGVVGTGGGDPPTARDLSRESPGGPWQSRDERAGWGKSPSGGRRESLQGWGAAWNPAGVGETGDPKGLVGLGGLRWRVEGPYAPCLRAGSWWAWLFPAPGHAMGGQSSLACPWAP